jgi:hypothetical protein
MIRRKKVGDTIALKNIQGGEEKNVSVVLEEGK